MPFSRRYTTDDSVTPPPPAGLWADKFGKVATRTLQSIILVIAIIGIVYAAIALRLVVIPVLLALIVAAALGPIVEALHRRGLPRVAGAALVLVVAVLGLGGLVTGIVFAVRSQWPQLVESATQGVEQLREIAEGFGIATDQEAIDDAVAQVQEFLTSSSFTSGAISGVSSAVELITGTVLFAFVLFYFLRDGASIFEFLIRPFQGRYHVKAQRSGRRALEVMGGYVRGTALVALVDAVFIGIGLFAVGIPFALALPLAVLVFVFAFVPIVGATAAGVLAALVALVTAGLWPAIIIVIIVVAVNQIEGNFLQPVVLGRSLQLHALVVLLAITAGTILAGITGAILSVPLVASAWAIAKAWSGDEPPHGTTVGKPPRRDRRRAPAVAE
ncbi:putative PurR-regulated permease PerM [Diaminobutyricimonas aerilata]|uniref:Putative PurR-regulated permease PerM n=1 Tax=Diaminobutyricimonas aerilata TaxID=1162967 RepID=A0A2M9CIB5_9MICO|nr:AI-2E family transporter [Diaminobutyricimonas aerilata]PJJ71628.1 putative PurR-regulated permease PerM [Diaminobutyricimonas aerilata]